ncbi:MAG: dihydrofolate reductase [Pirellulaceae bacterium]|nr:dihydrofolate reductase [Pirellulaceae bacterium]
MTISLIVAFSENSVIGFEGDMPWRLSADLKRFKRLTMGHPMIMGRNTYESIGRLLPGRTTIILTRNGQYEVPGALLASDLEQALELASADEEIFVVGGGQVYQHALPLADRIYATRIHVELPGDTHFPKIDWEQWKLVESTAHESDEKNQYPFTFENYVRKTERNE